ncbi:membrane or secreted protein [Adhaeribacter swui]|uniref:Membrane or secreted protein n=1 Tax=Adhaeribacter swui TaxID=2086471 RepID=A0A7G7G6L7_9BACT|nr:membrane or secreted protein [Adhaeribacter swui]QNF32801.1 membrane or secreted protein [Adhaeribacter swui]
MNLKLWKYSPWGVAIFLWLVTLPVHAITTPELVGAWSYGPATARTVIILTDNVMAVATYDLPGKKFISSYGGTWRIAGNTLHLKQEWNSAQPEQVGQEMSHPVQLIKNKLVLKNQTWNRLDDGKPGALRGAWVITGNYKDDQVSKRPNPFYPRRTMKVLSGTQFHWIAYNVETKQFLNAGGGTYTTDPNTYTETIEFFTKTPESVGKKVSFNYSFVNGDWRHRGEKSTGGPLDECWSKRETLEQ